MSLNYKAIDSAALKNPNLISKILPGGRINGSEYTCSDINGGSGDSFKMNMETGVWNDFGNDEKGGCGPIALRARQKGIEYAQAAQEIFEMLGMDIEHTQTVTEKPAKSPPVKLVRVPVDAPLPPGYTHRKFGNAIGVYWYTNIAGHRIACIFRYDTSEKTSKGKSKKEIRPWIWGEDDYKWVPRQLPAPRPLYGLHKLRNHELALVLLVEGEGKADALQGILGPNVAVLSLCGGSNAVGKMDFSPLVGRCILYWPDADEPGLCAAAQVYKHAEAAGVALVEVVMPPAGVPEGWDGGDAVKAGWSCTDLISHMDKNRMDGKDFLAINGYMDEASTDGDTQLSHIPPPPPVPLEAFPRYIASILDEMASAFAVPLQIPAACFLAFLSCLVGKSRKIKIKNSWKEAANLWVALVAPSGVGKSPCEKEFFRFIHKIERVLKKEYDVALAVYEDELAIYVNLHKKYLQQLAKDPEASITAPVKPQKPRLRQLIVNDATVEVLGDILQENPKGVMWWNDELSGLIFNFDRYAEKGGGGTQPRLLSAYDSGPWKTNRSSNPARNIYIPSACVGIFGGIQPGMMPNVFKGGPSGKDEASGFLQRFMFIRAESERASLWNEKTISSISEEMLEKIAVRFAAWDIEYDEDGQEIEKIVSVSPEAKKLYISWYDHISEEAFISQNSSLLAKLRGQAQRICLLLHCLDAALADNDALYPVSADTMRRALMLADWVKAHQEQCWLLFSPQKIKQPTPVERSIMKVIVGRAAQIECDNWKIRNAELFAGVKEDVGMPGLSEVTLGKSASNLGLKSCYCDKGRGREVSKEQMETFKRTVGTVGSVEMDVSALEVTSISVEEPQPVAVDSDSQVTAVPTVADSIATDDKSPKCAAGT